MRHFKLWWLGNLQCHYERCEGESQTFSATHWSEDRCSSQSLLNEQCLNVQFLFKPPLHWKGSCSHSGSVHWRIWFGGMPFPMHGDTDPFDGWFFSGTVVDLKVDKKKNIWFAKSPQIPCTGAYPCEAICRFNYLLRSFDNINVQVTKFSRVTSDGLTSAKCTKRTVLGHGQLGRYFLHTTSIFSLDVLRRHPLADKRRQGSHELLPCRKDVIGSTIAIERKEPFDRLEWCYVTTFRLTLIIWFHCSLDVYEQSDMDFLHVL